MTATAKPCDKDLWKGGRASTQAATRVKPEQAPIEVPWMPTRLKHGEGRRVGGRANRPGPASVHRGTGRSMRARRGAQHGRPGSAQGKHARQARGVARPGVGGAHGTDEAGCSAHAKGSRYARARRRPSCDSRRAATGRLDPWFCRTPRCGRERASAGRDVLPGAKRHPKRNQGMRPSK